MPSPPILLVVFDLAGIFVFATAGALVGVRKDFDLFGVLVLAGTTGLGGGFMRDVLIGAVPPAALADWRYLVVPLAAGFVTFQYHSFLGRREPAIKILDAFGLALFCVTGAVKATEYGLGPLPAALMGMVTGIGGGMVRDLLTHRPPEVFHAELYATPALFGALTAAVLHMNGQPFWLTGLAGGGLCLAWRLIAIRRNWRAPVPRKRGDT